MRSSVEEAAGKVRVGGVAELAHRFGFDLADSFASEVKVFTDFLERARFTTIQAIPQREDALFPLVKGAEQSSDLGRQQRQDCRVTG